MTRNRLLEVIKFELQFTGAMVRSRLLENTVRTKTRATLRSRLLRCEAANYDVNSRTTVRASCGTKEAPPDGNIGAPITAPKWWLRYDAPNLG